MSYIRPRQDGTFVFDLKQRRMRPSGTHYTYTPKGKYPWLQRVLFRLLAKLEARSDEYAVERIAFNGQTFMEHMLAQNRNLLDEYNVHGGIVLVGHDLYSEWLQLHSMNEFVSFHAKYFTARGEQPLHIGLVPWMRGMLLVPHNAIQTGGNNVGIRSFQNSDFAAPFVRGASQTR